MTTPALGFGSGIHEMMGRLPREGRLEWIGLRLERYAPIRIVSEVDARAGQGLEGDRYRSSRAGKRQVTLMQAEHLAVIGAFLGQEPVAPEILRRNLVVSGLNLLALKGMRFRIGEAVLEGTGPCPPCSRMEEALGAGGYNAMRGHGGLTARVIESGRMRVGDAVSWIGAVD